MDHKAALLALILVSGSLAGCTGDPGEGGGDEFDSEALQDLIDENLQDFMNNTSITVNNHFYNNTTVVNNDYDTNNDYNNTTNVDGGEINNYNQYNGSGSGSGSVMQMFTIDWDREEVVPDDLPQHQITLNGTLQVTNNDPTLLFAYIYEGNLLELRMTCEQLLNYYRVSDNQWADWIAGTYGNNGNYGSLADDIEDDIRDLYYSMIYDSPGYIDGSDGDQCGLVSNSERVILFEIDLEVGQALDFIILPNYITVDLNCEDGFGTGIGNGTQTSIVGGQADCTVTGSTNVDWRAETENLYYGPGGGSNSSGNSSSGTPTMSLLVWPSHYWTQYSNLGDFDFWSIPPANFAVYFTIHYVEVYDLDSE